MALGLHYMHEQRVLHRDLKTQNIFMLGNGRLVLGDLGISKVLEGEHPKPRREPPPPRSWAEHGRLCSGIAHESAPLSRASSHGTTT